MKANSGFYDYEHKYTTGATEHILPAPIPSSAAKTCMAYAETMHNRLGCKTVSRSDFRYNEKDGVIFLEINTHPGMTSLSLVPEQAKYIGVSYEDLCKNLVEEASCRHLK
jgi:D-alanine-D-alanine ligase